MNKNMKKQLNLKHFMKIRKDLYLHIRKQISTRLGQDSSTLKKYKLEFERDFNGKWKIGSLNYFLDQLSQAKVILLADFHGNHQSQKAHLRVLRAASQISQKVLAVECIDASFQEEIDLFLKNKIKETDFLNRVGWAKNWGFPWEFYRPIFLWAKKTNTPVIAINNFKDHSLVRRDLFAAKLISEQIIKNKTVFVIIGEWHLAHKHLPNKINKLSRGIIKSDMLIRVFQNNEKMYFQGRKEFQSGVLYRTKTDFCIQSVPPWVKWQNYLNFLEGGEGITSLSSKPGYDADWDDDHEYFDNWVMYLKLICKDLKIKVPNFNNLDFYNLSDDSFWRKVKMNYANKEVKIFEALIENETSFVLPSLNLVFNSKPSVNQLASLAMEYLHGKKSARKFDLISTQVEFVQQIWIYAISFFGSKLANPKRKSDSLSDLRSAFIKKESDKVRHQALKIALKQKMHELTGSLQFSNYDKIKQNEVFQYYLAASLLGNMLGEKIFFNFIEGRITLNDVHSWLQLPFDNNFLKQYLKIIKKLEKLPHPFRTKFQEM